MFLGFCVVAVAAAAKQARWLESVRDRWEDAITASLSASASEQACWSLPLVNALRAPGYFPSVSMLRMLIHDCLLVRGSPARAQQGLHSLQVFRAWLLVGITARLS